jgi:hypothetical protein
VGWRCCCYCCCCLTGGYRLRLLHANRQILGRCSACPAQQVAAVTRRSVVYLMHCSHLAPLLLLLPGAGKHSAERASRRHQLLGGRASCQCRVWRPFRLLLHQRLLLQRPAPAGCSTCGGSSAAGAGSTARAARVAPPAAAGHATCS